MRKKKTEKDGIHFPTGENDSSFRKRSPLLNSGRESVDMPLIFSVFSYAKATVVWEVFQAGGPRRRKRNREEKERRSETFPLSLLLFPPKQQQQLLLCVFHETGALFLIFLDFFFSQTQEIVCCVLAQNIPLFSVSLLTLTADPGEQECEL